MIDRAALRNWTMRNHRARHAYYAQPTATQPICEWCGHTSRTSMCPKCARQETSQ